MDVKNNLRDDLYFITGAFPYEYVYLPLKPEQNKSKFYSFGSAYYLPGRISHYHAYGPNSFSSLLKSEQLIHAIMAPEQIELVQNYCLQYFNKNLKIRDNKKLTTFSIYTIQCV